MYHHESNMTHFLTSLLVAMPCREGETKEDDIACSLLIESCKYQIESKPDSLL